MTAILFPGQGIQKKGMGQELFPKYMKLTDECSAILGYSIEELCLANPENKLGETRYLQPALFFVNMLNYLEGKSVYGNPSYFLGHSLGEYNALCAAGVFDLPTGIQLVKKRAELMGAIGKGGMAAILGETKDKLSTFLQQEKFSDLDIANFNTPTQLVISGPAPRIEECAKLLSSKGVKAIVLNVSGAFHSRYMKDASEQYLQFLQKFSFKAPQTPVISTATVELYSATNVAHFLSLQLSHPVRWEESIRKVLQAGISTFHEVGSQILSKMVDEIRKSQPVIAVQKLLEPLSRPPTMGSQAFREKFGVRHSYVAGAMYRGIASPALVIRMAKSKFLAFYGVGGLEIEEAEAGIKTIQNALQPNQRFGINFLCNYMFPEEEFQWVELFLRYQITIVEASAFLSITPALAYYLIKGLYYDRQEKKVLSKHSIFAKVSRLQVAQYFMQPVPQHILDHLLKAGKITFEEAELAKKHPVSQFVCVEGDSGGHTDRKALAPLLISVLRLRDDIQKSFEGKYSFFIGAAGGIGDPISMAGSYILGADFILTGSINQCTPESGTSDRVKALLQEMEAADTDYSIAGDMFEMGAKIQVLKKGLLFPVRANTLYNIYSFFEDLSQVPQNIQEMLQKHFFRLSFKEIAEDLGDYFVQKKTPKEKMAALFRWYLRNSNQWAISGAADRIADYQVHTGPALGLFNQWVKGTKYEDWKARHVDEIAELLIEATMDRLKSSSNLYPQQWQAATV
jgi:trans-AT polyketide synthase/acyltransferase/oxidoreductase domain-containing protein